LGRGTDAAVSGRNDRGRVDNAACRVASLPAGGALPWALLLAGSIASLAANVAVAEPDLIGRVIAAWPSFALTASYELLTRQVRRSAPAGDSRTLREVGDGRGPAPVLSVQRAAPGQEHGVGPASLRELQRQAWRWALANRDGDGLLPTGREIARQHGRCERWGRLVKKAGLVGEFADIDQGETAANVIAPRAAA
jgi:hypothetical protein